MNKQELTAINELFDMTTVLYEKYKRKNFTLTDAHAYLMYVRSAGRLADTLAVIYSPYATTRTLSEDDDSVLRDMTRLWCDATYLILHSFEFSDIPIHWKQQTTDGPLKFATGRGVKVVAGTVNRLVTCAYHSTKEKAAELIYEMINLTNALNLNIDEILSYRLAHAVEFESYVLDEGWEGTFNDSDLSRERGTVGNG